MSFLSIRKWNEHQHYTDRRPPWIKLYTRMLDDLELRALPLPTQLLWDRLLLLAAKYDNAILNDSESIAKLTGIPQKSVAKGIADLLEGRWIRETETRRRASKRLAPRKQNSIPETEVERETPKSPLATNNGSDPKLTCPECGISVKTMQRLAEHREVVHEVAARNGERGAA